MTPSISHEERARRIAFVLMGGRNPEPDEAARVAVGLLEQFSYYGANVSDLTQRLRDDIASDHQQGKHRPERFPACVHCGDNDDPGQEVS